MKGRDEIDDNNYSDYSGRKLKELEDTPGMRCCLHCINCVLKRQSTIYTDGRWYCFHRKEWKRGDDLFEYCCPGFVQKECANCGNRNVCGWYYMNVKTGKHRWCKRGYVNRGLKTPSRYAVGRRLPYRGSDPYVMQLEARYKEAHHNPEVGNEEDTDRGNRYSD